MLSINKQCQPRENREIDEHVIKNSIPAKDPKEVIIEKLNQHSDLMTSIAKIKDKNKLLFDAVKEQEAKLACSRAEIKSLAKEFKHELEIIGSVLVVKVQERKSYDSKQDIIFKRIPDLHIKHPGIISIDKKGFDALVKIGEISKDIQEEATYLADTNLAASIKVKK